MNSSSIYALASGAGRAGLAVIRVSGPLAGAALQQLTGKELPSPRRLVMAKFKNPTDGEVLDEGLAVWFPAPFSFTGDDVVELHVHGGRAVVAGLLGALGACEGLKLAEPGDFSRRAFENQKFDLTAAEGLADLVHAETQEQRRQAFRQMKGDLGRLYDDWRHRLLHIVANVEAMIDFSDEDLPPDLSHKANHDVNELLLEITAHLQDGRRGEMLRDGLHVVILGPPNSGKSSLFNLLTQRNAAIVSDTPGTTRDVIQVHLDIGGYAVTLADTAGLREGRDEIEAEGIRRAKREGREADLKLVVFDGEKGLHDETHHLVDEKTLVLINKADLGPVEFPDQINDCAPLYLSVLTGEGVDGFLETLEQEVKQRCEVMSSPALTQVRHRQALENCGASLSRFLQSEGLELAAEDLRLAIRALGKITGHVGVEDILDVIFKGFCIGK